MTPKRPLPQWTWDDLEAALDGFSPMGGNDLVRAHLMRGLAADAERASPRELLQQVLSAGWVMAQVGTQTPDPTALQNPASGIAHRHAAGASVS
ncbi:hypothetical protein [Brevundimonas sp. FT23028]|uniref:hypothetical protein n=1 Tax=Brevundimonas sp. FT23028 TaxID=3393748 RepID=UPI003B586201